jgi:hypothetical protein
MCSLTIECVLTTVRNNRTEDSRRVAGSASNDGAWACMDAQGTKSFGSAWMCKTFGSLHLVPCMHVYSACVRAYVQVRACKCVRAHMRRGGDRSLCVCVRVYTPAPAHAPTQGARTRPCTCERTECHRAHCYGGRLPRWRRRALVAQLKASV